MAGAGPLRYIEAMNSRITAKPNVCGGQPCIAGTRFRIIDALEYIAGGDSIDTFVAEFSLLKREDFEAAVAYAAEYNMKAEHACSVAAITALVTNNLSHIEAEIANGARLVIVD